MGVQLEKRVGDVDVGGDAGVEDVRMDLLACEKVFGFDAGLQEVDVLVGVDLRAFLVEVLEEV